MKDVMAQRYEKKRWYVQPTDAMYEEARQLNTPSLQSTTSRQSAIPRPQAAAFDVQVMDNLHLHIHYQCCFSYSFTKMSKQKYCNCTHVVKCQVTHSRSVSLKFSISLHAHLLSYITQRDQSISCSFAEKHANYTQSVALASTHVTTNRKHPLYVRLGSRGCEVKGQRATMGNDFCRYLSCQ